MEGIHLATPSGEVTGNHPHHLLEKIRNNHCDTRSGDIYVFQEPYWFLMDKGPVACMHGSPWNYDTHVPVIFSGPGIRARTIHQAITPADVAPTLSHLLGLPKPAAATGTLIQQIVE